VSLDGEESSGQLPLLHLREGTSWRVALKALQQQEQDSIHIIIETTGVHHLPDLCGRVHGGCYETAALPPVPARVAQCKRAQPAEAMASLSNPSHEGATLRRASMCCSRRALLTFTRLRRGASGAGTMIVGRVQGPRVYGHSTSWRSGTLRIAVTSPASVGARPGWPQVPPTITS
jgi:hypothetical protein